MQFIRLWHLPSNWEFGQPWLELAAIFNLFQKGGSICLHSASWSLNYNISRRLWSPQLPSLQKACKLSGSLTSTVPMDLWKKATPSLYGDFDILSFRLWRHKGYPITLNLCVPTLLLRMTRLTVRSIQGNGNHVGSSVSTVCLDPETVTRSYGATVRFRECGLTLRFNWSIISFRLTTNPTLIERIWSSWRVCKQLKWS